MPGMRAFESTRLIEQAELMLVILVLHVQNEPINELINDLEVDPKTD